MESTTQSCRQTVREATRTYQSLSGTGIRFVDFIARRPEACNRSSFGILDVPGAFQPFPLQPWPVFVSARRMRQMGRVAVQIARLVKSIPRRLFGNDPARISSYYGIDREAAALLLKEPDGIEGALARGDFVLTPAGLRCLEVNMASHLGGWQNTIWAGLYQQVPLLAEFIGADKLEAHCRNTVRLALEHVVRTALGRLPGQPGEVNLAILIPPQLDSGARRTFQDFMEQQYSRALCGEGVASGRVVLCEFEQLGERQQRLQLPDGSVVEAVIELADRPTPPSLYRCFKAGFLDLYNGPVSRLLSDKRNMALLSENADQGIFSASERELIEKHLPWTRTIRPGEVERGGERRPLPDLLLSRREELVVKKGISGQGRGVHLGCFTPGPQWVQIVERALQEGGWVVQDYVESLPFPGQAGRDGSALCDVVWGLFSFGGTYGGGFLSFQPQGEGGVVNVHRGASQGILLEVEEPE